MQIDEPVAVLLDRVSQTGRHGVIGIHVEQNTPGITEQPVRPAGDDKSADDSRQRVHPQPSESAREQKPDDREHGDGGVGEYMHVCRADIVVAQSRLRRAVIDSLVASLVDSLRARMDVVMGMAAGMSMSMVSIVMITAMNMVGIVVMIMTLVMRVGVGVGM